MKACLIVNPAAGQRDVHGELAQAIAYLEGCGWQVTRRETLGHGDATTFARQAVHEGCDVVLTCGGDGTLNEAVQALAGTPVTLGALPVGTGNVWARQIGLPIGHPAAAARLLAAGERRTIDLGLITGLPAGAPGTGDVVQPQRAGLPGQRYFLLWAGIGFDATVAQEMETGQRDLKRHLGIPAYVISGLVTAASFLGTRATFVIDGVRVRRRLLLAVVANARLYAAILHLAPQARLDDGWLDVVLFQGQGTIAAVRHFLSLLARQHLHDPEVTYYRAREITVQTARPLLVQADGDPVGSTPLTFRVVPRALRVLLPRPVPEQLFEP